MADSSDGQQPPSQDNPFAGMEVGGSYKSSTQGPAAAPAPQGNPFEGMEVGGAYQSKKPEEKAAPAVAGPSLGHTAKYLASKGAESLAGLYDLPDTIDKGISYGLNKYAPSVGQAYDAFDKATTLAQVPSATQALYSTGLAGPQGPQAQSATEKLLGQGVAGATSALPVALATGGTSLGPLAVQALSGAAGNISGENLGPYASSLLQMTGLSKGAADVVGPIVAGGIGGATATGAANRVGNAITTLAQGEGPLAALGAAMPGKFGTPNPSIGNLPNAANDIQAAKDAGLDIPAPLWQGSGTPAQNSVQATAESVQKAQGQYIQGIRNEMKMGEGTTITPEEYSAHMTNLSTGKDGYEDTLAKIGINQTAATQLQDDLTRPGGVLDQLKNTVGSSNPALPKLENTVRQIYEQADQGAIPGDIYQTMVNKGSPLSTQLAQHGDPDLARGAALIKKALDDAIANGGNAPEDVARLAELNSQWKLGKTLEPVINSTSSNKGMLDPQGVYGALSSGYGGVTNAPGQLPALAQGGRLLPGLTPAGSIPVEPSAASPLMRVTGNMIAGGVGASAALGDLISTAQTHGTQAVAALLAALTGSGAVHMLGKAQKSYASTPGATQRLMDIIRGNGPTSGTQGLLAGASGPTVAAGQPQQ